jgi:hypothetical protein
MICALIGRSLHDLRFDRTVADAVVVERAVLITLEAASLKKVLDKDRAMKTAINHLVERRMDAIGMRAHWLIAHAQELPGFSAERRKEVEHSFTTHLYAKGTDIYSPKHNDNAFMCLVLSGEVS